MAAVRVSDAQRTRDLRQRYLDLMLDALQARTDLRPLHEPPPLCTEIADRWSTTDKPTS